MKFAACEFVVAPWMAVKFAAIGSFQTSGLLYMWGLYTRPLKANAAFPIHSVKANSHIMNLMPICHAHALIILGKETSLPC